jgi:hypothetical protein
MKTKLLFICGLIFLFGMSIRAQIPTFTIANSQVIGDSIIIYRSDTLGLNQGSSGTNVTWNFSTLDSIGAVYRYTMSPSVTPYPILYPSSNRAEKTVSGTSTNYQFYNIQKDSMITVGTSGGVIDSTIYSNTDKAMIFPFTYLNTFYDSSISISYYNTGGLSNRSYHSRTTTADGYGTLILPNATYTNVLRYKVVHNEIDSLFSGANFNSKTTWYIEEYLWVDAGYRAYLLYVNPLKNKNGVPQAKSVHYVRNPHSITPTGIQTNNYQTSQIIIYPNPSTGIINIAGPAIGTVTVLNSLGQIVIKTKMTGKIDISKIAQGLYFIQLLNEKNEIISTTKMIKE